MMTSQPLQLFEVLKTCRACHVVSDMLSAANFANAKQNHYAEILGIMDEMLTESNYVEFGYASNILEMVFSWFILV